MPRRAIVISGVVQGVGFRPFVYALASQLELGGFAQNRSGVVWIEIEGGNASLDTFIDLVQTHAPPLSRIDSVCWHVLPSTGERIFRIADSDGSSTTAVFVSPDVGTCSECRRELFDPTDRRFRYPFLNCTNCGPRLTIIHQSPYDRVNTTMSRFVMCKSCREEYEDPRDRRFHAQPIACPDCGPRLQLLDNDGDLVGTDDPLLTFVAAIRDGKIGAIKGLGGYHLACIATSDSSVATLRERKNRDQKPFAVMVPDALTAKQWCHVSRVERELMESPRRPIVLLRKLPNHKNSGISDAVAPANPYLGVMLPYTPLHELLLGAVNDQPLVMTSGNRSDEPIAYEDDDAVERLRGIADLYLIHNRPIRVRCDDSVTRVMLEKESPIRRSRGYAPMPIKISFESPQPLLAVGGQLKGVFALVAGSNAFLSHHMGDLDHWTAMAAFQRDIELYQQLFGIQPRCIVHDLHPDYASTTYAQRRAIQTSLPTIGVQHHHAHLASCMAEHRIDGEVIGVIFDGSGYGTDGMIWGGEFLVGGFDRFFRAAHLRPVRLPGGDKATKEPWRMALSYLEDADCDAVDLLSGVRPEAISVVRRMIERGFHAPWTSSMGRLFDAIASLAGIRQTVSFEGQAAMQLEALATDAESDQTYPFVILDGRRKQTFQIDSRPLIRAVVDDRRQKVAVETIARRFHNTLAEMTVDACQQIRHNTGIERVVLSGGVFMNAVLSAQIVEKLGAIGFDVYQHHIVPPNDGGLSLGQIAIAAYALRASSQPETATPKQQAGRLVEGMG